MSNLKNAFCTALIVTLIASTAIRSSSQDIEIIDRNLLSEYFQNQQYAEAKKYLESKKAAESADVGVVNSLGYAYFMNDDYTSAEKQYSIVLRRDSLNLTANRYMALIQEINKKYDTALFFYERVIKLQPANAWFYKLMGDTYVAKKQFDSALILYSRSYHLQSGNIKIVSVYADNLLDKQLYATADSVIKMFLRTDSSNVIMMKLGIRSATEQDKMANAAVFTNRWIRSGEIDPTTSAKLAVANYSIQNYKTCYLVCDTLLSQGVETESLLYYASKAMSKLNNYAKSNELLRRCLDLAISKNTNVYYFALADNLESSKNYKKAIAAYDTAYYLFKNPLALYNMGRLYELAMDDKSRAEQYYRKYLSAAKPTNKDERKVYAYVKERLALRAPFEK